MTPVEANASKLSPTNLRLKHQAVKPFSFLSRILFAAFFTYSGWFLSRWMFHLLYFYLIPGVHHHSDLAPYLAAIWITGSWLFFLSGIFISSIYLANPGLDLPGKNWNLSLLSLLFVFHVHLLFFEPVRMSGPSMLPTYKSGTLLFIEKLTGGIGIPRFTVGPGTWKITRISSLTFRDWKRGDVVALLFPGLNPDNDTYLIKRIVGLPGDSFRLGAQSISIETDDGAILEYPESGFPAPGQLHTPVHHIPPEVEELGADGVYAASFGLGPVGRVPPDSVLVLGDNPRLSRDSRSFGFVPLNFLVGRVIIPNENPGKPPVRVENRMDRTIPADDR